MVLLVLGAGSILAKPDNAEPVEVRLAFYFQKKDLLATAAVRLSLPAFAIESGVNGKLQLLSDRFDVTLRGSFESVYRDALQIVRQLRSFRLSDESFHQGFEALEKNVDPKTDPFVLKLARTLDRASAEDVWQQTIATLEPKISGSSISKEKLQLLRQAVQVLIRPIPPCSGVLQLVFE